MNVDPTSNVRAGTPQKAPASLPVASPSQPLPEKDVLLAKARAKAADVAAAQLQAAQLPERGHFLFLHSQQDNWVRDAAGVVAKAYADLQTLEAGQADPLSAKPQAVIDQARARVSALAQEVAAHDPRNVRSSQLHEGTRELSLAVRLGADVSDPPLRGTMTAEQFAKAKDTWAKQQHDEITAGRAAAAKLGERAELLHVEDANAHMGPIFDAAEQKIQDKLGPVQWGQLIRGLIEVGGAVGSELARQQAHEAQH